MTDTNSFNQYSTFIHQSKYARWREEEGRREVWDETVDRYVTGVCHKLDTGTQEELRDAITELKVMPSMRALMTAGEALDRDNVAGFNCSYIAIDHQRAFDEMMYILMCGTGVGFSVERQYISRLPEVAESFHPTDTVISVGDSKIGWAKAFKQLISFLYQGEVPDWDVSKVRPAGSRLKTFGGRASGSEPLAELFRFSVELFKGAAGRKLTSYECHILCCKIADIVVVGGVRRSALIGLSNLTDDRVRRAKHGNWWDISPELRLANNSACYTEKPDFESFLSEWHSLYESKSGERGLFSRVACQKKAAVNGRRDPDQDFGTNPCSEIILRPSQFCNLSEVVVRSEDSIADLEEKVRLATIIGTVQATMTDFRYLRPVWKRNTEEEALLGVSLTGIMDHPVLSGKEPSLHGLSLKDILERLRGVAVATNKIWAKKLGINQSTAITCVKPSGTVSQLVNSASGIHPRYASKYVRRVRADVKDPLAQMMRDQGVPCEVDVMNPTNLVFSFPQAAPELSTIEGDHTSLEFMDIIDTYNKYWCEHKVSATVHYKQGEFLGIGQWVWDNFDDLSGLSFLPYDGHTYQQAPYEAISDDKYEELVAGMVEIDWSKLGEYEVTDSTTGSQELACSSATGCEI